MPKLQQGDRVLIGDKVWTIASWPEDDKGFFTAHHRDGSDLLSGVFHTGDLPDEGEPIHESVKVKFLEHGTLTPTANMDLAGLTVDDEEEETDGD